MTSRLRAVPDPPRRLRALSLIRVSKERLGMVSPEIQRTAITDYAQVRGYEVVAELEGLDESGSRTRSAWWARLDQAVGMVEAGQVDVVLVWKFSRAARHRLKWATALDRIEQAGGQLESATEQIDASTAVGGLARGMLGEINVFEARRTGEGWKEAHANRVGKGKPATGKPKFGYVYDLEEQLHVPDPVTGPVLADLYRRYVAGESVYQLVRWLNGHGHKTTAGGVWSDRSLRRVLDSGFASGRFMAGGDSKRGIAPTLHDGVHQALIDEDLWQAYQDARGLRRARPARSERSQYLLSGLVRCTRCGGPMVAGQYGRARRPKYRCKNGKESGPEVCTGGYVMAGFVEDQVFGWLQEQAADVDTARDAAAAAGVRRTSVEDEVTRLSRQLASVEASLQRLVVSQAKDPVPDSVYKAARAELEEEHAGLVESLESSQREVRRSVLDPGAVARGLVESWETRPVEHRREVLRSLVRAVWVTTGRPRAEVVVDPVWAGGGNGPRSRS